MAKKIRKVYNTKLLYRWSLPLWLTLFFILIVVAPLVVSLFMQCFDLWSDSHYEINSLNIVMNLFQQPNEAVLAFQNQIITPVKGLNNIIGMVVEIGFNYVMPAFALLMALFDIILVIFFLLGLLSGRFHHWKGPFALSVWATVQAFFYYGLMIGLTFYMNSQFPNIPDMSSYTMGCMYAIIYLSAMLVATIILGIIYSAGFKGREFIPNKTYLENFIQQMTHGMRNSVDYTPQPIIINNNTTPAPQAVAPAQEAKPQAPVIVNAAPQKVVETKYVTKVKKVYPTEVDQSLKYISGHAYAKNVHLLSASIPEGVDKIGASAFANCVNIKVVTIPTSVKEIGYNAFFNCKSLERIVYAGRKEQWRKIKRGSNWLNKAGTTIVSCVDGAIQVNPYRK